MQLAIARKCKSYTLAASDIDLHAEGNGPAAWIRLVTAGSINIQSANGGTNVSKGAAEAIVGAQPVKVLVSGSTAGIEFEAYWP